MPSERRGLGKEKYKGDTSEFLDKLAEAPEGDRGFEKWFYGEWLARRDRMLQMAAAKQASRRAREGGDLDEAQLQVWPRVPPSIARPLRSATPHPMPRAASPELLAPCHRR